MYPIEWKPRLVDGVGFNRRRRKKNEANKNPDAGMDVDKVVKEDGAAAVAGGGQDAAAHAPAAEGGAAAGAT